MRHGGQRGPHVQQGAQERAHGAMVGGLGGAQGGGATPSHLTHQDT